MRARIQRIFLVSVILCLLPCFAYAKPPAIKGKVWTYRQAKNSLESPTDNISGWNRKEIGYCWRTFGYNKSKIACYSVRPRAGKIMTAKPVSFRKWIRKRFFQPDTTPLATSVSNNAINYRGANFRILAKSSESDGEDGVFGTRWSLKLVPAVGPALSKKGFADDVSMDTPTLLITPFHALFYTTCQVENCGSDSLELAIKLPAAPPKKR